MRIVPFGKKKLPAAASSVGLGSGGDPGDLSNIPCHTRSLTLHDIWSGRADLNGRPLAPQASTLPGCATPRHAHSISPSSALSPWSLLECNRFEKNLANRRQSECDSKTLRIAWRFPRSFCASSLGRTRWLATRPRLAQYRLTPASVC